MDSDIVHWKCIKARILWWTDQLVWTDVVLTSLSCSDLEMLYHLVISVASIFVCVSVVLTIELCPRWIAMLCSLNDRWYARRRYTCSCLSSSQQEEEKGKNRKKVKQTDISNKLTVWSIDFINGSRLASICNHSKWTVAFPEEKHHYAQKIHSWLVYVNHFSSSDR